MSGPHEAQPLLQSGPALGTGEGVLILLHGRGGSAANIMQLGPALLQPLKEGTSRITCLAPAANGGSWYPQSFLAPREENEPYLTSALETVARMLQLALDAGVPHERIVLGGFSQGACLSSEFVASHPARYGGLIAFTGGLVGPLGSDVRHNGDLSGMPALLLSGDPDPHVPWSRVEETAAVLTEMGATVNTRRFPGRPHVVSSEEIILSGRMLTQIF